MQATGFDGWYHFMGKFESVRLVLDLLSNKPKYAKMRLVLSTIENPNYTNYLRAEIKYYYYYYLHGTIPAL